VSGEIEKVGEIPEKSEAHGAKRHAWKTTAIISIIAIAVVLGFVVRSNLPQLPTEEKIKEQVTCILASGRVIDYDGYIDGLDIKYIRQGRRSGNLGITCLFMPNAG